MSSLLVLQDGTCFEGESVGTTGSRIGEVILNTAVVGYQEIMTDPANAGKILVFTYPLIGNCGVADGFNESDRGRPTAIAIKEMSNISSNWQAQNDFGHFLAQESLVALTEVDTRTLAVKIRRCGEMLGAVSTGTKSKAELLTELASYKEKPSNDFISDISVKKVTPLNETGTGPLIGILDLGMLRSFTAQIVALGCRILLLPYDIQSQDVKDLKLDGLVISGGPEEDKSLPSVLETVRQLLGVIPILGISTGHEIIARALGAKLNKLKLGHRGVNYPVIAPGSFKGEITAQNHRLVVDEDSLSAIKGIKVNLHNVNDKTIEEMESASLNMLSVQYYPASPGCGEVNGVFLRFLEMIERSKGM